MESFLCEGKLRHRRFVSPSRDFTYPLFMLYLDLDELQGLFEKRWLWSVETPNVASFWREDHYGDPSIPLDVAIRDLVAERTGHRPEGPVRLLTHLRYFGYGFNPVSFYYCFAPDGGTLEAIVAEVSNTPWNERHMYVLPEPSSAGGGVRRKHIFRKAFHVSPFLPMDIEYRWRLGRPPTKDGQRIWVHMENWQEKSRVFDATLVMERHSLDGLELARALAVYPAMTARVVGSIYTQALRLWVRRARVYSHPTTETSRDS